jgi:hypothetical protein
MRIPPAKKAARDLVRLSGLRVALQPQRSQAVHIFDRRIVLGMLLLKGVLDLRLTAFVFIENRFGYFVGLCAHQGCCSGETTR